MKFITSLIMLSLFATTFVDASYLEEEASALQPGEWKELTGTNLEEFFFKDSTGDCIFNYSDKGVWYPDSQWVLFSGSGHGGAVNPGKFIIYKVKENSWERRATGVRGDFSHAYSFNTIDVARGMYYHYDHSYPGGMILRYDIKEDLWSNISKLNKQNTPTGMLEYFPERDTFVFIGNTRSYFRLINHIDSIPAQFGPSLNCGTVHVVGRYNKKQKCIMAGWGEDGWPPSPRYAAYIIDSSLNISAAAPCSIYVAHPHGMLSYDPVSGEFLVFGKENKFMTYDVNNDEWKTMPKPTVPVFDPSGGTPIFCVNTPIDEMGVVLFLKSLGTQHYGWSYSSKVYLYKHDPAAGIPLPTGVKKKAGATSYILPDVYPNPFNPHTTIRFKNPLKNDIRVSIVDISGRIIYFRDVSKGAVSMKWNGTSMDGQRVSTGIYSIIIKESGKTIFPGLKIILSM